MRDFTIGVGYYRARISGARYDTSFDSSNPCCIVSQPQRHVLHYTRTQHKIPTGELLDNVQTYALL